MTTLLLGLTLARAHDAGPQRIDVWLEPGTYQVDVELHPPPYRVVSPTFWDEQLQALPESLALAIDQHALTAPTLHAEPRGLSTQYVARYQGPLALGSEQLTVRSAHATGPWLLIVRDRGDVADPRLMGGAQTEQVALDGVAPQPLTTTLTRFLWLGFVHIVPRGLDHILFVLGLFLAADRARPLLLQVSAFTAAHTLTLGAGLLGWVQLSGAVVEPLIAASIVVIALENLALTRMPWWRPAWVFALGLLHGLGFAGVLTGIGLPAGQRLLPLLSFNVGVELGQLVVLAVAFVLVGRWWNAAWYRKRVVIPGSAAIAAVGLYWTVERLLA